MKISGKSVLFLLLLLLLCCCITAFATYELTVELRWFCEPLLECTAVASRTRARTAVNAWGSNCT